MDEFRISDKVTLIAGMVTTLQGPSGSRWTSDSDQVTGVWQEVAGVPERSIGRRASLVR